MSSNSSPMRKTVKVSAPGKLHLIGEYSAVYLKPAILCAIDRHVTVILKPSSINNYFPDDKTAQDAVKAIQNFIEKKYKIELANYEIKVQSDLPIGRGMGSSAALCAVVAGAFFALHELSWDLDEIFNAAYEGEKVFHGNPSGGDLAVCIYGGIVWFRKEAEQVKLFKKIEVPNSILKNILLIDSGKPVESTKEMVAKFLKLKEANESKIKKFSNLQEDLTRNLLRSFIEKDNKEVFDTLFKSERNLESLGIVGKKVLDISKILGNNCAIKISGAGGYKSGCGILVAFCKDKKTVKSICEKSDLKTLNIHITEEGVRIEK